MMKFYLITFSFLLLMACGNGQTATNPPAASPTPAKSSPEPMREYSYEIVNTYPHDEKAFTQGLEFNNGYLYEGTGGKPARGDDFFSSLRKVELNSGKVVQKYDVPHEYFGEGITILGDKIFQVTWQERTGFVYNLSDFKLLKEFKYNGEGWGLTNDGTHLYMSDGTHVIRVIDPETFQVIRSIQVRDPSGRTIKDINELEMIDGKLWANVWQADQIIMLDPQTGFVSGYIEMKPLVDQVFNESKRADVLNGIAHDAASGRIFITGKNWKKLYEIKVAQK